LRIVNGFSGKIHEEPTTNIQENKTNQNECDHSPEKEIIQSIKEFLKHIESGGPSPQSSGEPTVYETVALTKG